MGYVKEPFQKFFFSLTVGGKTERFCKKWVVDSWDEEKRKYRVVFDTREEAMREFNDLKKDYEVER